MLGILKQNGFHGIGMGLSSSLMFLCVWWLIRYKINWPFKHWCGVLKWGQSVAAEKNIDGREEPTHNFSLHPVLENQGLMKIPNNYKRWYNTGITNNIMTLAPKQTEISEY